MEVGNTGVGGREILCHTYVLRFVICVNVLVSPLLQRLGSDASTGTIVERNNSCWSAIARAASLPARGSLVHNVLACGVVSPAAG